MAQRLAEREKNMTLTVLLCGPVWLDNLNYAAGAMVVWPPQWLLPSQHQPHCLKHGMEHQAQLWISAKLEMKQEKQNQT